MTAVTIITSVPLSKLVLSPRNVRKTGREIGLDALEANIMTKGLLQNLVVTEAKGGKYAVEAGGRRFAVLKKLAKAKAIPASFPVPVKIVPDDEALAASLAENVMQSPMHPADQYEAFSRLIETGRSIEDVAAQFGITPAVVTRRMKLASVALPIIEAFRADRLTLDQVMGFTVSNDHAEQIAVFEEIETSGYRYDRARIIGRLTSEKVRTDDRRFQFVGEAVYIEAGGTISRDLFDAEGEGYADDTALLDRLAMDRLAGHAETLKGKGWKWIEPVTVITYDLRQRHNRIHQHSYPISQERSERLSALGVQYDELVATLHNDTPQDDEGRQRLTVIEAEMDEIEAEQTHYDPTEMALAGGWIGLDSYGDLATDLGYVRSEDMNALDTLQGRKQVAGKRPSEAGSIGNGDGSEGEDGSGDNGQPIQPPEPTGPKMSDALLAELHAARTIALRLELANRPDIALRAVAFTLAGQLIHHTYPALTIRAHDVVIPQDARAHCPDDKPLRERLGHWGLRLPSETAALWQAILALPETDLLDLIAVCAASTIDATHAKPDQYGSTVHSHRERHCHADQLAASLNIDMRQHWTVSAENYLGRVNKEAIKEAVIEAKGEADAASLASLKKTEMAEAAASLLAGTGWLPAPLRARA